MRVFSIVAAITLVVLTVFKFVPELSAFQFHLSVAAVAMAVLLLVSILADRRGKVGAAHPAPVTATPTPATPPPAPVVPPQADAEIISFLATLQERGRLVDFLMEDITAYADAQVGAAARVVHGGCQAVLKEHFGIHPLRTENEGSRIEVPAGFAADEYRLTGKIGGTAPFSGKLVHRGWKTEWVKLPRLIKVEGERLPTIAPAEVELG